MKIVFMGTPDFSRASLEQLLNSNKHEIVAVYCQPDRPKGRGQKLQIGPVKALALEHNIEVFQPINFKDRAELDKLRSFNADIFVVAAYGLILPQELLDIPPLGAINVHSSLLPKYRGAAPIQRAVMNGDTQTGVTIMRIELKLDSGPIIMQRALGIGFDQTAGEIHDELAELGGKLLVETIDRIKENRHIEIQQEENLTTYAAKLSKADGFLDLNKSVLEVHNLSRGVSPWPGAQLVLKRNDLEGNALADINVLVQKGQVIYSKVTDASLPKVGTLCALKDDLLPVACSDGLYGISQLKPAGSRSMSAKDFANGHLRNCTASFYAA